MSKLSPEHEDALIFSLSDLGLLCRRKKRTIQFVTLMSVLFMAFFTLSKPSAYEVEATFREKDKQSGLSGSISSVLGFASASSGDREAIALMQSRTLMEPIVKRLGLQAVVSEKGVTRGLLSRLKDNLRVQLGYLRRVDRPVLPDRKVDLRCHGVEFYGEVPSVATVTFTSSDHFELYGLHEEPILGRLGEKVVFSDGEFTLSALVNEKSFNGRQYVVALLPLHTAAESYAAGVTVTPADDDSSLLRLEYAHPDRYFAASFLNEVMDEYQRYLTNQNDRRAEVQLAYLEKRKADSDRDLHALLSTHAASLSTDVFQTGFPDSDKEMEFLALAQQHNSRRLMAIDLELKRIAYARSGDGILYDKIFVDGEQRTFSTIMSEVRSLKQQRDSLELAIRQVDSASQKDLKEGFEMHIAELDEVRQQVRDVRVLQEYLENGKEVPKGFGLSRNPQFLVGEWLERWESGKQHEKSAPEPMRPSVVESRKQQHDGFTAYLRNLVRTLSVQEKTIEERLTHQQNPHLAFQGIDLKTAEQLYVNHQRDLSDLEAQVRGNLDILDQMRDPGFDVTSLSQTLSDPISHEMITESSRLTMQLRDVSNRTEREQERLSDSLQLHREFLTSHVRQQTHLLRLRRQLVEEKNEALMRTMFDLIHREISILEKHIHDHVSNRQETLIQEQSLLSGDQQELRFRMAQLPERWVSEQLISMHMSLNEMTVEEISKLVESKNISHNLETIESAPVDIAIVPLLPRDPKLILFSLVGATLGFFMAATFVILRAIATGVPVSAENLRLSGQRVAGTLSRRSEGVDTQNLSNGDLETLRQIISFLPSSDGGPQRVLLAVGRGPRYARHLADLLQRQGKKSLLVEAAFDKAADPVEQPGLLQVLTREATAPLVIEEDGYDRIAAGGISRYSAELLGSVSCETLLRDLQQEYDYLFVIAEGPCHHAETLRLLDRCHSGVVTASREKLSDLNSYSLTEHQERTTFVLVD